MSRSDHEPLAQSLLNCSYQEQKTTTTLSKGPLSLLPDQRSSPAQITLSAPRPALQPLWLTWSWHVKLPFQTFTLTTRGARAPALCRVVLGEVLAGSYCQDDTGRNDEGVNHRTTGETFGAGNQTVRLSRARTAGKEASTGILLNRCSWQGRGTSVGPIGRERLFMTWKRLPETRRVLLRQQPCRDAVLFDSVRIISSEVGNMRF